MSDILTHPIPQTEAEYEVFFHQLLTELQSYEVQSRKNRADIDRLKAETEALKAIGHQLEAENQIILTRLKAMV